MHLPRPEQLPSRDPRHGYPSLDSTSNRVLHTHTHTHARNGYTYTYAGPIKASLRANKREGQRSEPPQRPPRIRRCRCRFDEPLMVRGNDLDRRSKAQVDLITPLVWGCRREYIYIYI